MKEVNSNLITMEAISRIMHTALAGGHVPAENIQLIEISSDEFLINSYNFAIINYN